MFNSTNLLYYQFGDSPMYVPFFSFADSAATDYNVPDLCNLKYSLTPALDATAFGTSLSINATAMNIEIYPTDHLLINKSQLLYLLADATPQQDLPS